MAHLAAAASAPSPRRCLPCSPALAAPYPVCLAAPPARSDIGGSKEQIEKMREVVELPMLHPEKFVRLGIDPPKVGGRVCVRVAWAGGYFWQAGCAPSAYLTACAPKKRVCVCVAFPCGSECATSSLSLTSRKFGSFSKEVDRSTRLCLLEASHLCVLVPMPCVNVVHICLQRHTSGRSMCAGCVCTCTSTAGPVVSALGSCTPGHAAAGASMPPAQTWRNHE